MMEFRNTANQRHVEAQAAKEWLLGLSDIVTQRLKISAI